MKEYGFNFMKLCGLKNQVIITGFIFLEKYFFGCYTQHMRIKEDKLKIKEYAKDYSSDWQAELRKLFLDIHFYLICWANIRKILRRLGKTIKDKKFQEILVRYNKNLDEFIEFRTYLEHLIEDLENKKKKQLLKNPMDIGNLSENFFTFGGKKIYIGKRNLKLLDNLYHDLNEWLEEADIVEGSLR